MKMKKPRILYVTVILLLVLLLTGITICWSGAYIHHFGFALDNEGNFYLACEKSVRVFAPDGSYLCQFNPMTTRGYLITIKDEKVILLCLPYEYTLDLYGNVLNEKEYSNPADYPNLPSWKFTDAHGNQYFENPLNPRTIIYKKTDDGNVRVFERPLYYPQATPFFVLFLVFACILIPITIYKCRQLAKTATDRQIRSKKHDRMKALNANVPHADINTLKSSPCLFPAVGAIGAVIVPILFFGILSVQDTGSPAFISFGVFVALICLASAIIGPHRFILDHNGIIARHLAYRRTIAWSDLKEIVVTTRRIRGRMVQTVLFSREICRPLPRPVLEIYGVRRKAKNIWIDLDSPQHPASRIYAYIDRETFFRYAQGRGLSLQYDKTALYALNGRQPSN